MIKKFFIIFSFVALVTTVTTVYGAEETATQKCWHHILEAKDNQQRKAAIAFKDCVRRETSTSTSKLKWPKSVTFGIDKEEKKAEKALSKQDKLEEKERIKAEKELAKQAKLEEKERIKAEKATLKAEKKLLKEKRKKTCAANPKSADCKKATAALDKAKDNIKGLLKKIKNLGGKKIGEPG